MGVQRVSETYVQLSCLQSPCVRTTKVPGLQHNTSSFTAGFLARSWAHKVHTRRNPLLAHMEIGEFGVGRPHFGGRRPRGEALCRSHPHQLKAGRPIAAKCGLHGRSCLFKRNLPHVKRPLGFSNRRFAGSGPNPHTLRVVQQAPHVIGQVAEVRHLSYCTVQL